MQDVRIVSVLLSRTSVSTPTASRKTWRTLIKTSIQTVDFLAGVVALLVVQTTTLRWGFNGDYLFDITAFARVVPQVEVVVNSEPSMVYLRQQA
jgi:hypothetical protein